MKVISPMKNLRQSSSNHLCKLIHLTRMLMKESQDFSHTIQKNKEHLEQLIMGSAAIRESPQIAGLKMIKLIHLM